MFKCIVCGSIGQNPGRCGICGREVREIRNEDTSPSASRLAARLSNTRSRRFWTGTRIIAFIVLVVVAVSSAGAGTYLLARPSASSPSCKNVAVNYPSCDSCGSWGIYNSFTNSCQCSNGFVNPPSCDRSCANGAINGAVNSPRGEEGCDQCPDHRTDIVCPPALPTNSSELENKVQSEHPRV